MRGDLASGKWFSQVVKMIFYCYIFFWFLFLVLPVVVVVWSSFTSASTLIFPPGLSLKWYQAVISFSWFKVPV